MTGMIFIEMHMKLYIQICMPEARDLDVVITVFWAPTMLVIRLTARARLECLYSSIKHLSTDKIQNDRCPNSRPTSNVYCENEAV